MDRLFIHFITSGEDLPVPENASMVVIRKSTGIVECIDTKDICESYIAESELSEGIPDWEMSEGSQYKIVNIEDENDPLIIEGGFVGDINECREMLERIVAEEENEEELRNKYKIKRIENEKDTDCNDSDTGNDDSTSTLDIDSEQNTSETA